MKKRKPLKRGTLEYIAEVNGLPFEEHLRRIPKERWDGFLDYIADLLFRDMQKERAEQAEEHRQE